MGAPVPIYVYLSTYSCVSTKSLVTAVHSAALAATLAGGSTSGRAHGQPSFSILPSGKAEASSATQQPQKALQETASEAGQEEKASRRDFQSVSRGSRRNNDGSEVVDLLEKGPVLGEDDDDLPRMTSDELSALRRTLFGKGSSTGREWNDLPNFVPNSYHMVVIMSKEHCVQEY
ncbi:hypothetical protein F5Y07DRAFT_408131 [Xylaria sp. FL0933]|nr:hypothetical protein F5Y07DRAFT_408131 [Xylaria sp. FL0933]